MDTLFRSVPPILPRARWQELQGIPNEDHGQHWHGYNGKGGNWERKFYMEDLV